MIGRKKKNIMSSTNTNTAMYVDEVLIIAFYEAGAFIRAKRRRALESFTSTHSFS